MNIVKRIVCFIALAASTIALINCGGNDNNRSEGVVDIPPVETPEPLNIVETAVAAGSFNTLVAALQATGLDATLADESATFTVFAPTDDAFALLGEDTINALLADTDTLSDILLYHVISGSNIDSGAAVASAGSTVNMANGDAVGLSYVDSTLKINLSNVTTADIETANGTIHVIDAVLMPPVEAGEPVNNIVETAIAAGSFTNLVAALQAAGLDDTLADESATFTVFAPTDAAFEAIGTENLNALLADTDALTEVLLLHVIADAAVNSITAYSLNGGAASTAGGTDVDINIVEGQLQFGGANVVTTDIYTTNGIIHVIDTVITETLE